MFSLTSKTKFLETSLTFLAQLFTVHGSFVSLFLIFLEQHFIRFFALKCATRLSNQTTLFSLEISVLQKTTLLKNKNNLNQQNEK